LPLVPEHCLVAYNTVALNAHLKIKGDFELTQWWELPILRAGSRLAGDMDRAG